MKAWYRCSWCNYRPSVSWRNVLTPSDDWFLLWMVVSQVFTEEDGVVMAFLTETDKTLIKAGLYMLVALLIGMWTHPFIGFCFLLVWATMAILIDLNNIDEKRRKNDPFY